MRWMQRHSNAIEHHRNDSDGVACAGNSPWTQACKATTAARGKYRPSNFKNNIIELSWTASDHDRHQPRERSRPSRVPTQRKIVAPVDFAAPRSTSHREGSAGETA